MGPYCKYCGERCFVHMDRWPDHVKKAYGYPDKATIASTCRGGQAFERKLTGFSYDDVKDAVKKIPAW